MKHEPPKHIAPLAEHAPTVIHDEYADETQLARWLRRGMEKGPKFWGLAIGSVVALTAVLYLVNAFSQGDPKRAIPWESLATAKDADERLKVAEEFPTSPAASWARLQVAGLRFNEATQKLTTDREEAVALLGRALELYREVEKSTSNRDPQARLAALGAARTLEARNELKDAIEQYQKVASTWPDTDEAKQATRLAEALKRPENVKFYEQLYSYKAPVAKMPAGGPGLFDSLLPKGHPPLDGPLPSPPDTSTGPIRVPGPDTKLPEALPDADAKPEAPKAGEIPDQPFAPDKD